ncbi:Oxygen-insensitive NAD(P)H nitroreductase [Commensalibacter sp. Nvir]|uniref:oxygen-insensitive NAD(P)H nitroreductase n=1 Tax=Commensalibacter sp. Nvir TaxID=3069817 RepID=UPI002D2816C6|nr:Oxygen-insensitive NAD(P)H nitroreductase [Commensalibacter sp. Nvir]
MHIETLMKQRYTTKKYNPNKKIPKELLDKLLNVLRLTPTSINSQPYHFIVATSQKAKTNIAESMNEVYQFNAEKVIQSSHAIVICSKTNLDEDYLRKIVDEADQSKRFNSPASKEEYFQFCKNFLLTHRYDKDYVLNWMKRQCYIALGTLLIGSAALGIDSTAMEGFDTQRLDKNFDLNTQQLTSLVVVSLGYRAEDDYNSILEKSRLPLKELFTLM